MQLTLLFTRSRTHLFRSFFTPSHTHFLPPTLSCPLSFLLFQVMVWSYQFLSVEAIIENCTGHDVGRLAFIDEFSLLVVTDSEGLFTLIPVGVTEGAYYPH